MNVLFHRSGKIPKSMHTTYQGKCAEASAKLLEGMPHPLIYNFSEDFFMKRLLSYRLVVWRVFNNLVLSVSGLEFESRSGQTWHNMANDSPPHASTSTQTAVLHWCCVVEASSSKSLSAHRNTVPIMKRFWLVEPIVWQVASENCFSATFCSFMGQE